MRAFARLVASAAVGWIAWDASYNIYDSSLPILVAICMAFPIWKSSNEEKVAHVFIKTAATVFFVAVIASLTRDFDPFAPLIVGAIIICVIWSK